MNCYFHANRTANGQCRKCSRALCVECFNKGGGVCPECALEEVKNQQKQIRRDFIVFGITFVIMLIIALGSGAKNYAFLLAYILAATMFGYRFVVRLFPKNLVVFRVRSALFYKFLKIILGFLIGWAVAPWQLIKSIRLLVSLKRREKEILL